MMRALCIAPVQQDGCNGSSHYAGGILTLVLTSFNPPLNFIVYWLILHRKSGQRDFSACPDGRLHHLGNSPASMWAKVMGRLFFLESYCVTQPLTPRWLYQRLFCVPSCRIFTFVSGHCWLPMRGDGFSMADFFMSCGLNSAGLRLKESGLRSFGSLLTFRLFLFLTF